MRCNRYTYSDWFDQAVAPALYSHDGLYGAQVTNHIPDNDGWKTGGHDLEASNLLDIIEIMSQWTDPNYASYGCWDTGGQGDSKALGPCDQPCKG